MPKFPMQFPARLVLSYENQRMFYIQNAYTMQKLNRVQKLRSCQVSHQEEFPEEGALFAEHKLQRLASASAAVVDAPYTWACAKRDGRRWQQRKLRKARELQEVGQRGGEACGPSWDLRREIVWCRGLRR